VIKCTNLNDKINFNYVSMSLTQLVEISYFIYKGGLNMNLIAGRGRFHDMVNEVQILVEKYSTHLGSVWQTQ
jgi:hypothetical protein